MYDKIVTRKGTIVQDPPIARFLFSDVRMSWVWLVIRLWVGYQWIKSGSGKVENPAWVQTGDALKGFWTNAVAIPETGSPAIKFGWYRSFIEFLLETESYTWFGKLIAYGEVLIGIALILGLFTGIAAVMGGFMNWNFIMAGAASSNGMMFLLSVLLIMAWKTSGYLGLDFFALPFLGTPWPGKRADEAAVATA